MNPAPTPAEGRRSLDQVEDRDSVADGAEDAVAVGGEEDVSLLVNGPYQVRELQSEKRPGVSASVPTLGKLRPGAGEEGGDRASRSQPHLEVALHRALLILR